MMPMAHCLHRGNCMKTGCKHRLPFTESLSKDIGRFISFCLGSAARRRFKKNHPQRTWALNGALLARVRFLTLGNELNAAKRYLFAHLPGQQAPVWGIIGSGILMPYLAEYPVNFSHSAAPKIQNIAFPNRNGLDIARIC